MSTRLTNTVAALAAAAVIGVTSLAAPPAMAAGQISFGFSPSDPGQRQALGLGLQVFSLVQGLSTTGANANQNGTGNAAGFTMGGSGNHGLIYQDGNGHNGTIQQSGGNNSCGLFQFGRNTSGQCFQNGGESGITTVFGF